MAFVAVVPAVGSAVLPALGTAVGGLGTLASSIPVVGGSLGSLLGTSAAGSGLAGALGSLGTTGSLLGAGKALGAGLSGMIPAFGGMGAGVPGITGGLGKLYGGADALLGGMLPGGITPAQGFLGQMFPNAVGGNKMFGGAPNPFDTHGVVNPDFNNPFDLAQMQGLTQPTNGGLGLLGMLKMIGDKGSAARDLVASIPRHEAPASPQAVQHSVNLQKGPKVSQNGGQAPQRRSLQLGSGSRPDFPSPQPNIMTMEFRDENRNGIEDRGEAEFMSKYYQPRGRPADSSLQRL